jgi:hypothetical protein
MWNRNGINIRLKMTKKHLAIALIAALIMISWSLASRVQAGTLTNVFAFLSNDLPFPHRSQLTVFFTTATAGAIKTIHMFPAQGTGLEVQAAVLLEVQGVGAGVTPPVGGGVFAYTVNNPVNVPAGTTIKFVIADWPNLVLASNPNLHSLRISTFDPTANLIDEGLKLIAIRRIEAGQIAADAVGGSELAGVTNIRFGRCRIDPPAIPDNGHVYWHVIANPPQSPNQQLCDLGVFPGRAPVHVIAFPGGAGGFGSVGCSLAADPCLHSRLVPKGSYSHCAAAGDTLSCHLDVVIKNTAPGPSGSVNDEPKIWVWIAWQ